MKKIYPIIFSILLTFIPFLIFYSLNNLIYKFKPNHWLASINGFYLIFTIVFSSAIFIAIKYWFVNIKYNFKVPTIKNILVVILLIMCLKMVSFVANPLFFFEDISNGKIPFLSYKGITMDNLTIILSLLTIEPIIEEVIFRKIIFTKLSEKYSIKFSIILSSILFAIAHFGYTDYFKICIYGIFLCLIFYYTKNILLSMIAHSVFNFITLNTTTVKINLDNIFNFHLLIYIICFSVIFFLFNFLKKSNQNELLS